MWNSGLWSNNSAPCRIEWRPSRVLVAALMLLGVLGAVSLLASEIPASAAWLFALGSLASGARFARKEAGRPLLQLAWSARGLEVEGRKVDDPCLDWRGPLVFLRWRDADGRPCRVSWWPDTLDGHARRELRLAASAASPVRATPSMAP